MVVSHQRHSIFKPRPPSVLDELLRRFRWRKLAFYPCWEAEKLGTAAQYVQAADQLAHRRNAAEALLETDCYGQVQQFIILPIALSPDIPAVRCPETLILAAIKSCEIEVGCRHLHNISYRTLGPLEVVDINLVEGVIGRVRDRGRWVTVERKEVFRKIILIDGPLGGDET